MRLKGLFVDVDFVDQHLVLVVVRQEPLELQGSGLLGQTARSVSHQQRQELVASPGRDFQRGDNSELCQAPPLETATLDGSAAVSN